ncbi:alpha-protein kinase 1 [Archocentrus centrarchus]|uniref:alpha-protein kinase 1 n=1 Tax=Archocentrus centrarchus TaxID=63155 RepID=UPI0011EA06E6|nr:alpha-protein kinase 1-like [Archocentrus centrarchus]XP_030578451.1 alpha-protein kinase 1-like [Archocentrus centrarchus]
MDSQEVGGLLDECFRAAQQSTRPTEAQRLNYCSCRDSLCAELASLLQEAVDMKWPFVPEKWQYKQSVSATDKTNLSDLISKHLSQLLAVLKASIGAQEARTALAVVFLVDRYLYWTDESNRLLKIAKLLHRRYPDTPIAPQLVIRQARVYFNSGKLQKAEYILSSLINNSGTTGCWIYHSKSDRALVQAVSVQVRGMILQKLGLWLEAAELIWASLVGYYSLPQPDKKGIGTSLGILANILVSMNNEDFHAFRTNPDIDFSLLGDGNHRLLSAAQAAKMAVVYSQYTSLYVLTNVTTQGACLLSYSFSMECPASQRQSFLQQAQEAFAIGLLTKAEGDMVTSKQELHTFLKAAYSLAVTHKWLGTPLGVVAQAVQACQNGLANFYSYCHANTQEKDSLCTEIMHLVAQVKLLLRVEPFLNSDKGSFIPDSYRNVKDASVNFTLAGFSKIMKKFQKYHASLCETTNTHCRETNDKIDGVRLCITALGTTIGTLNTDCTTDACKGLKDVPKEEEPRSSATGHKERASNQNCPTTEVDDDRSDHKLESPEKNKKQNLQGCNFGISSHTDSESAVPLSPSSNISSDSEKFEVMQAGIETLATEEDWMADVLGEAQKVALAEGAVQSLSELFITSSNSLGNSFGSQSSWEKLSADLNSSTYRKQQPSSISKAGTCQNSKSPDSDGSFFILETLDSETSDSPSGHMSKNQNVRALSSPQPFKSINVYQNMVTEVDSVQPATDNTFAIPNNPSQAIPEQCPVTETSTTSSFEMLEVNQCEHQQNTVQNVPQKKNSMCYSCQDQNAVADAVPVKQFLLSQQDYQAFLAGVCHGCLLKRLYSDKIKFKLKNLRSAHSALHLKFSKATGLWTATETCVYIGEPMGMEGAQRTTIWVQFLHQEERLSHYVGKDYKNPKEIQFHLKDVERQMTAQYYVTEFNKSLYEKDVLAQIFFIPSQALLILNGDEIVGCVTVEPYMLGEFVKLTNNTRKKDERFQATEYGLAFGHFTYLFSGGQEVVVDLQGWVTANGKGLTYLTDPQIHSIKTPKGPSNFADRGLRYFVEEQHGPECNGICQLLRLPPLAMNSKASPQTLLSVTKTKTMH